MVKINLRNLSCSGRQIYQQRIIQYVLGWRLLSEKYSSK